MPDVLCAIGNTSTMPCTAVVFKLFSFNLGSSSVVTVLVKTHTINKHLACEEWSASLAECLPCSKALKSRCTVRS